MDNRKGHKAIFGYFADFGASRQGTQLAEGQKSADVKHNLALPPPLRPPREMAEGVEFFEKNAGFDL
jgi:hypothetical protein